MTFLIWRMIAKLSNCLHWIREEEINQLRGRAKLKKILLWRKLSRKAPRKLWRTNMNFKNSTRNLLHLNLSATFIKLWSKMIEKNRKAHISLLKKKKRSKIMVRKISKKKIMIRILKRTSRTSLLLLLKSPNSKRNKQKNQLTFPNPHLQTG